MRNLNKVRAFTIMEVTVSMLIAALVIGITYTAYSIISKSYLVYNTKNQEMAVLVRVNELLNKDFDKAGVILKDEKGLVLKDSVNNISYEINPDYIVRTAGIVDTFKVKTQQVITSFAGQPVNEPGINPEQSRVDELDMVITYQNETIPYHYFKHYSSVNLFQHIPNAIN